MNDPALTRDLDWPAYLQLHVDELERCCAALPTDRDIAQWTRVDLLGDITDCHHALSDVLRCVVELNTSHYVPPDLVIDVDAVLHRCVEVDLHLDDITRLVPLASAPLPSSWAEL